ncbi:MAG: MATE family efflux transporter [Lachnospiraceae bacterium]|jgi:putative MATE family efflux protein|nr:MATE family efflux transporter [Lachnospiraceae bacterium]
MLFSEKDLRKLIWPLIVEQFLAILVGMLDTVMISGQGEAAVSGVSLVDNINVLVINFTSALGTGGAVIAGHFLGQKRPKDAGRAAWQLLYFSLLFSTALVVLLLTFRAQILHGIFGSVDADVMQAAMTYFVITGISIAPLAVYNSAAGLFRAMNDSRTTMLISLLMNGLNFAGNSLLIYGFHMGVAGAAISTTISRTVAAVMAVWLLFDSKRVISLHGQVTRRFDGALLRRILFIGIPNGTENSLFQMGKVLLLSFIATFGTSALAANSVDGIIASFSLLPAMSINLAIISVTSVCIGAGDFKQARYYTRKLCILEEICTVALSAVCYFAVPLFVRAFSLTPATQQLSVTVMRTHCVFASLFWVASFAVCNTLRSAGDVVRTMAIALFSMWVFRIGSAYLIQNLFHLGLLSVWLAMYIDWIFRSVYFLLRYKGHKWEHLMTDGGSGKVE